MRLFFYVILTADRENWPISAIWNKFCPSLKVGFYHQSYIRAEVDQSP